MDIEGDTTTASSSPVASTLLAEDPVLTTIFEFAVGDLNDFRSVSMVNKNWNHIFRPMALQLATRICDRYVAGGKTKKSQTMDPVVVDNLEMVFIALAMSTNTNTTRPKEGIELPSASTEIALHSLFHDFLTSRKRGHYFKRPLYDKTCEYMEHWAILTARNMALILLQAGNGENHVAEILAGLLDEWNVWSRLTRTSIDVVSYLDRCVVTRKGETLSTRASCYLARAIVQQGLSLVSSCEQLLHDCRLPKNAADARPLLLQVQQVCKTFQSGCPPPCLDIWYYYDAHIWESLWKQLQEAVCEEEPTSSWVSADTNKNTPAMGGLVPHFLLSVSPPKASLQSTIEVKAALNMDIEGDTTTVASSPVASTLPTEDLVLTTIFEYTVGDPNEFRSVSMVNKNWNHIFRPMAPQLAIRICKRYVAGGKTKKSDTKLQYMNPVLFLEMVFIALAMCTTTNNGTRPKKVIKLPSTSTKITLYSLFYEVFTFLYEGDYFLRQFYDKTCEYLEHWAILTARNMARTLETNNGENVPEILMGLLEEWNVWSRLTRTCIYVVSYLDRCFVKEKQLMPLWTRAYYYLARAIVQRLSLVSSCEQLLHDCRLPKNAADTRPLLLQVHQACKTFQSGCLPRLGIGFLYDAHIWDSLWKRFERELDPKSFSLTYTKGAQEPRLKCFVRPTLMPWTISSREKFMVLEGYGEETFQPPLEESLEFMLLVLHVYIWCGIKKEEIAQQRLFKKQAVGARLFCNTWRKAVMELLQETPDLEIGVQVLIGVAQWISNCSVIKNAKQLKLIRKVRGIDWKLACEEMQAVATKLKSEDLKKACQEALNRIAKIEATPGSSGPPRRRIGDRGGLARLRGVRGRRRNLPLAG